MTMSVSVSVAMAMAMAFHDSLLVTMSFVLDHAPPIGSVGAGLTFFAALSLRIAGPSLPFVLFAFLGCSLVAARGPRGG